jgi:hypothetical protein
MGRGLVQELASVLAQAGVTKWLRQIIAILSADHPRQFWQYSPCQEPQEFLHRARSPIELQYHSFLKGLITSWVLNTSHSLP